MRDILNSKKKWDNSAAKYWKENLRPPWRPSQGDIENYKGGILMVKKPVKNILILGATPELRVLANQLGEQVWLVDQSFKMLREMGKLAAPSVNFKKEKHLIGDWCSLKIPRRKSFDVILGDLVLRLLNPKKQMVFLEKISHLLSSKGLFITRIHFVNKFLVKLPIEKIIKDAFSLLDPAIPGRGTVVKNLLISRILDKNSNLGSSDKIRNKSRLDIKNYLTTHPDINTNQKQILKGVLNRFEKKRLAKFFPQTKKEIEKNFKYFFEMTKFEADDYEDAKFFPLYVLKPKHRVKLITRKN
jgi:hypothetical protein